MLLLDTFLDVFCLGNILFGGADVCGYYVCVHMCVCVIITWCTVKYRSYFRGTKHLDNHDARRV